MGEELVDNSSVFVSSTYTDLASYRREIWKLLEARELRVIGMEEFGARKEAPLQTCLAEVEQSDIYLAVIGFRLGSIDPERGKSFTQLEYERARELGKEILIYIMDPDEALVPPSSVERGLAADRLDAFKETLKANHTVSFFSSEQDLVARLERDLDRVLNGGPGAAEAEDLNASVALLRKFLLVPRSVSGREILVVVKCSGSPYPASKEICQAFNLTFGAAVGVDISIEKPEGFDQSPIEEMYASGKEIDSFLRLIDTGGGAVYAVPAFHPNRVSRSYAHFTDGMSSLISFASLPQPESALRITEHRYEADGKVALLFSGIAP